MKRIICIIITGICFVLLLSNVSIDEWSIKEKSYDVNIPITTSAGTINEIEAQVRYFVLNKYPHSYLGNIIIEMNNCDKPNILENSRIKFVYYKNIGDCYGIYSHERFMHISVYVDTVSDKIIQLKTYGNNQLGKFEQFEDYPDTDVIYSTINYYKNIYPECIAIDGLVNILHGEAMSANFDFKLQDGSTINIGGQIKNIDDKFKFIRHR